MALPSFLKRKPAPAPPQTDANVVQRARSSARRRVIGAAVLLAIGVIAFPLVFETQPRPIPVDIPIEIPRKDGLPPLVPPARTPRVATGQVAEVAGRAVAEPVAGNASVAGPAAPPAAVGRPQDQTPTSAAAASPPARAAQPAAPAPDKPVPETAAPKVAAASAAGPRPSEPAANGRFVVQVGAFAEPGTAREVRLKVEKLGLKTYTQVVETAQGKRIRVRVGPYPTPEEAGKVLARLKAAQLPGAVLTL